MTISKELASDIHSTVDALAIAKKKLAYIDEELAKRPPVQAEVEALQSKLMNMLDKLGFTEEAVTLLLAAR